MFQVSSLYFKVSHICLKAIHISIIEAQDIKFFKKLDVFLTSGKFSCFGSIWSLYGVRFLSFISSKNSV